MKKGTLNVILVAIIVIALGYIFSNIVFYVIVSAIIAAILLPIVDRLDHIQVGRFNFPRAVAVLISFGILGLFISAFVSLFIPLFQEQVDLITSFDKEEMSKNSLNGIRQIEAFLIENNIIENQEKGFIFDTILHHKEKLFQRFNLTEILNSLVSFTGNIFITTIAVFFISFFLLFDKGLIRRAVLSIVPNKYFELSVTAFDKIKILLSNYLNGLVLQMLSIFILVSAGLSLFGVKYAITIAIFTAVANLIPYLGPILGAFFGLLVIITTSHLPSDFAQQVLFVLPFCLASSGWVLKEIPKQIYLVRRETLKFASNIKWVRV
jgi:predicted PurR-regulated permease PerM